MKKKIVTSLLVTPLALNVMADANLSSYLELTKADWTVVGTSLEEVFNEDGVNATISTVSISRVVKGLPQGVYTISFPTCENLKLTLKNGTKTLVDGKVVTGGEEVSFTLAATSDVEVILKGATDTSGFKFSAPALTLKFDFAAAANALTTAINGVEIAQLHEASTDEALAADRSELVKKVAAIVADITTIPTEEQTGVPAQYEGFHLYNTPNDIAAKIATLKEEVAAFAARVSADNTKCNNIIANNALKATREAEVVTLNTAFGDVKASIEAISDKATMEKLNKRAYVNGECGASVAEINSAIEAYKAAIASAFAVNDGSKVIECASQLETINGKIAALNTLIAASAADYDAHVAFMTERAQVTDSWTANLKAVKAVTGVKVEWIKNSETVYTNAKQTATDAITKIYNEAINGMGIKVDAIKGASAAKDADIAACAKAKADMTAVYEALKAKSDSNNAAVEAAVKAVAAIQTAYADASKAGVPTDIANRFAEVKNFFNATCADATKAIAAEKEKIAAAYLKADGSLTEKSYDFTAANTAIAKIAGLTGKLADLQSVSDDYNAVNKLLADNNCATFPITSKYQVTLDKLTAAMNALKVSVNEEGNVVVDAVALANVKKEMADAKQVVTELCEAYKSANDLMGKFTTALNSMNTRIAARKLVAGAAAVNVDSITAEITAKHTEFLTRIGEVNKKNHNDWKSEFNSISADLKSAAGSQGDFTKAVTWIPLNTAMTAFNDNNKAAVDAKLAELTVNADTQVETAIAVWKQHILDRTAAATTAYTDAYTAAKAAKAKDDKDADWTAWDTKAAEALTTIATIKADGETMLTEQNAYTALAKAVADLDLKGAIAAATEFNNAYSLGADAKATFKKQIDGYAAKVPGVEALPAEAIAACVVTTVTPSETEGEEAVTTVTFKSNVTAEKDGIVKKASDLLAAINKVESDVRANEELHGKELSASDNARKEIVSGLAYLAAQKGEYVESEWTKAEWEAVIQVAEDSINSYIPTLADFDRESEEHYGTANLAATSATRLNNYEAVQNAVKAIIENYDAKFGDRVIATNNTNTGYWADQYKALGKAYTSAIGEYNSYRTDLTNSAFKSALGNVDDHRDIFDFYAKIEKLNNDFNAFVRGKNTPNEGKPSLIAASDLVTFNAQAATITKEIAAKLTVIREELSGKALDYLMTGDNSLFAQATEAVAAMADTFAAAGVSAEVAAKHATAATTLSEAVGKYEATIAAGVAKNVVLEGDKLANTLENVINTLIVADLQAAAQEQWNAVFGAFTAAVSAKETELASYTLVSTEDATATITAAKADADTLNTEATAAAKLIDVLANKVGELQALESNVNVAVAAVQTANETAKEIQDAQAALATEISTVNSALEALKNRAAQLAIYSGKSEVAAAQAAVDRAAAEVKLFPAELGKAEVETSINEAKSTIADGGAAIVAAEQTGIQLWIGKTKVAFNEVATNGNAEKSVVDSLNTVVEGLVSAEAALKAEYSEEFFTKAAELEKNIAKVHTELKGIYDSDNTTDGVAKIKARLEERYADVTDRIAEITLFRVRAEKSVAQAYAEIADGLNAELDAVKSGWEAQESMLLYGEDAHMNKLNAIDEKVKAAIKQMYKDNDQAIKDRNDAEAEQARQEANTASYNSFNDKLDEMQTVVDGIRTYADGFELGNYAEITGEDAPDFATAIAQFDAAIAAARTNLDAAHANNFGVTADYNLGITLDEVNADAEWFKFTVNQAYTWQQLVAAGNAVAAADAANTSAVIPSVKVAQGAEIASCKDALTALMAQYGKVINNYLDVEVTVEGATDIEKLANIAAAADAIAARGAASQEVLKASTFIKGDVNNNGEVNVADAQQVIDIIGSYIDNTYASVVAEGEDGARKAAAADFNADNDINIADVTGIVNHILDQYAAENTATAPRKVARRGVRASGNYMAMQLIATEGEISRYALNLTNSDEFVGGQFDLIVPAGMEVVNVALTGRSTDHQAYLYGGEGTARVIIASMENSQFVGVDGAIAIVEVRGKGTLDVDNAIFADSEAGAVKVNKAGTSMIDSIQQGVNNMKQSIYNAAGQTLRTMQRGINIIRNSDGTTTKELRK